MNQVFNPPPNWPKPPAGWFPPAEWRPDPAWGPAPSGWSFWIEPEGDDAGTDPRLDGEQHIFISYRRSDCQAQANGLFDGLAHRLKNASVFMDIDSIPPGVDFEQHIRNEIKRSDVILVMIGDNWLDNQPGTNRRRIDVAKDFVRLEIENALALPEVRIIPVLVEGAQMPPSEELPESIQPLARRHAFELSDHRWSSDVERLARTIERPQSGSPPSTASPFDLALGDRDPSLIAGLPQQAHRRRSAVAGWLIAVVPLLTCGFGSFAPALWARSQRPGDPVYRRRMLLFSIIVGVTSIGSFVMTSAGGGDPASSQLTPMSSFAVSLWFGTIAVATVVAVLNRKPWAQELGSPEGYRQRRWDGSPR